MDSETDFIQKVQKYIDNGKIHIPNPFDSDTDLNSGRKQEDEPKPVKTKFMGMKKEMVEEYIKNHHREVTASVQKKFADKPPLRR